MGSFANTLFTILLGWLQGIVSAVWSAFTTENGQTLFTWIGQRWMIIAAVLCFIGLSADLCVYVFRWKPFRVWKSFFSRNKTPEEDSGYMEEAHRPPENKRYITGNTCRPGRVFDDNRGARADEPDLSQWMTESKKPARQPADDVQPPLITNAGYSVPADSPYRRPAGLSEMPSEPEYSNPPKKNDEPNDRFPGGNIPFRQKRRRRISVNELFADPQEELLEFDAPQDIIDRKKAYHEPVYPSGWKKSENNEP